MLTTPGEFDVLCGQGRSNSQHFGNQRYQELLDEASSRFIQSPCKTWRQQIVLDLIANVRSKGEFLKVDGLKWVPLPEHEVYTKVSQALRYRRRSTSKKSGPKGSSTSKDSHVSSPPAPALVSATTSYTDHFKVDVEPLHQASVFSFFEAPSKFVSNDSLDLPEVSPPMKRLPRGVTPMLYNVDRLVPPSAPYTRQDLFEVLNDVLNRWDAWDETRDTLVGHA